MTKTSQSSTWLIKNKQAHYKGPSSQPGWQDKASRGKEAGGEEEVLKTRESKIQLMYPFCQFLLWDTNGTNSPTPFSTHIAILTSVISE